MSRAAELMTPRKEQSWVMRILRWARGLVLLVALAVAIGWTLKRTTAALDYDGTPAGAGRGILHGALMPLALPNLLVGQDVPIYSARNTGVPYKLGYTLGVNACGALFFGCFYWRLNRMRRNQTDSANSSAGN